MDGQEPVNRVDRSRFTLASVGFRSTPSQEGANELPLRRTAVSVVCALLFALLASAALASDLDPHPKRIHLEGEPFRCTSAVDLELVKVEAPPGDAVLINGGCTGRIRRLEVDTWTEDGVKIRTRQGEAHDLVVHGGYVRCHAVQRGAHQDALQAGAGDRIRIVGVSFDCLGNSNFFVSSFGRGTPTSIVCDRCYFGPRSSSTVFIGRSVSSGVRNSVICEGRSSRRAFRVRPDAVDVVNVNNTIKATCP